MDILANNQLQIFLQLFLATLLGGLVGLEREHKKKEAGLRTYALVSLGSALFTIISFKVFNLYIGRTGINFDPSRIIGQIAVGIGFIGAGLIIHRQFHVEGLTTAAGLWVTAAIGVAVGLEFYWLAISTSILAIVVLAGLRIIEEKLFRNRRSEES